MLWSQVEGGLDGGNAVAAWDAPNESGFELATIGPSKRTPIDFDGLTLVAFTGEVIELERRATRGA
jgi:CRISPR-associated protein Cas2